MYNAAAVRRRPSAQAPAASNAAVAVRNVSPQEAVTAAVVAVAAEADTVEAVAVVAAEAAEVAAAERSADKNK